MKAAVLFLAFLVLPGCSKSPAARRQAGDRPTSFFGRPLASDDEKAGVTNLVNSTLARHVTFKPGGMAATVHTAPARRHVEWKNLRIEDIHFQPLTAADKLNGISKRFLVSLRSDAHRVWDDKKSAWSEWKPSGYLLFPTALAVELRNGAWVIANGDRLAAFVPG